MDKSKQGAIIGIIIVAVVGILRVFGIEVPLVPLPF